MGEASTQRRCTEGAWACWEWKSACANSVEPSWSRPTEGSAQGWRFGYPPTWRLPMIRVLIADDHGIVRTGLKLLLDRVNGIEVVGEAEDGRTAVRLAKTVRPHVVVMDIGMPLLNGLEAASLIIREN